jgi:hypothetical protein
VSYLVFFENVLDTFGHRNGNANFVAETRGLWVLRSGKLKKYAGDEASGTCAENGMLLAPRSEVNRTKQDIDDM